MLFAQLNEYFSAMVDCVFETGGTLDKFIGDALMASWGSLQSRGGQQDAVASVEAALAMQEKLRALNETWTQRGWPELRVGMAINYGEVVVGNIGSQQRMEFTLIGDAVNVSWKLQELTKTTNAKLIVSESVANLVGDRFDLRSLGSATLDDSHQQCEIFTIGKSDEDIAKKQVLNESWHPGVSLPRENFTVAALRLSKLDVNTALKEGGRGSAGSGRGKYLAGFLVVTEMALAVVLLSGAGLMIRSFMNVYRAQIGVNPADMLTMRIDLPAAKYAKPEQQLAFYDKLRTRLASLPGVEGVTFANNLPSQGSGAYTFQIEGKPPVEPR
jgi:hypothetical protein